MRRPIFELSIARLLPFSVLSQETAALELVSPGGAGCSCRSRVEIGRSSFELARAQGTMLKAVVFVIICKIIRNSAFASPVQCMLLRERQIMQGQVWGRGKAVVRRLCPPQLYQCPAARCEFQSRSHAARIHARSQLPIEAATVVVLSRWCTTEAPWRI